MKTIITSDACVNHNGTLEGLIKLLYMVHSVNELHDANILFKVQKRNPVLYSEKPYYSWLLNKEVPYRIHKEALEIPYDCYRDFDGIAKSLGVEWYCSVFDFKSLEDMSRDFNFNYWKIASPVTADLPELVEEIGQQNGIKIISTGMCYVEEIDKSVDLLLKHNNKDDIIILHCTSMYPTPNHNINLNTINFLQDRYQLKVGFSSHDSGVPLCVAAVAMGACAIEKHITTDRTQVGPDHASSLEFHGLETLVRHIKAVEQALGSFNKIVYDAEIEVRNKVRLIDK